MPKKSSEKSSFSWVNRITELRYLSAHEMVDHPLQHKIHRDFQRSAMRGVLEEVGISDALRAYVSPSTGQLTTIDGHLRKSLGDGVWPVLILDVNDEEAAYILATGDEVTGLAEKEQGALARLLETVKSEDSAVQQMLRELGERERVVPKDTFTPKTPQEPHLRSECFIEIACSEDALESFLPTLNAWDQREDVTVNVQR